MRTLGLLKNAVPNLWDILIELDKVLVILKQPTLFLILTSFMQGIFVGQETNVIAE